MSPLTNFPLPFSQEPSQPPPSSPFAADGASLSEAILEPWPPWKVSQFFTSLIRITASCGFALSWVENPEVRQFLSTFIPQAPPVSRHKLTNDILRKLTDELRNNVQSEVAGKDAVLQCDGWTGLNHSHLIAFMIVVEGKVFTIKVEEASKERRDAKHLLFMLHSREYRIVRHLEPLAIATNAVQGVQVGLDRVLLTFGFLAMWYRTMLDDPASGADEDGVNAILASLESRWKNADQEIFIAALILNPFYRTAPFNTLSCFNNASVTRLLIALYKRLYKVAPPADFHSTLTSYLHGTGLFKGIDDDAQEFITTSIAAVSFFCSLTSHAYRVLIGT
ncbi:hypothetical protein BDZ89DRAFT_776946 [Hymenopellis radicata]|nr:hypothetical protein BDZ89DRAFT_776946 [Hymenopellis radicata]